MLEKGANHLIQLEAPFGPLGHSANDELKSLHRHLLGPDPLVEPRTFRRSEADGDHLFVGHVNSLPSTIGGGGFHADGKLPRFREDDFRLRSALGPVEGADVVDWPLAYEDLEPYYAEAERLVGVAGEETNPFAAWRSGPFPMPPGPDMQGAIMSMAAAERAGLHPYRCPTGVNSVPYDGRPACNNCGFCGGFGCPIEAKGDPVALLRRALRTGRCDIRPESYVVGITTTADGRRATGVRYLDADRVEHEVRAAHVVLAAGAFETPRLLLRTDQGPARQLVGAGRAQPHVPLPDPDGRSVPAATRVDEGSVRHRCPRRPHRRRPGQRAAAREAGSAVDAGRPGRARRSDPAGAGGPDLRTRTAPRRGHAGLVAERSAVGVHHAGRGPGPARQPDRPRPHRARRLRVPGRPGHLRTPPPRAGHVGPRGSDPRGRPARGRRRVDHHHDLSPDARRGDVSPLGVAPASYHIMGTTRMGAEASTSVVGPEGRMWDVDNVLVVDSSVFATSAGYNPTLTIMAMAGRTARLLLGEPLPPTTPHP